MLLDEPNPIELKKIYDRRYGSFMFVGHNKDEAGDHTVYSCVDNLFDPKNFDKRTGFVFLPCNDSQYQIFDTLKQAFLFVGNGVNDEGLHTVYASPKLIWKDEENFRQRTTFFLEKISRNTFRIKDIDHNAFLIIGNSDEGGDHTVYAVEQEQFSNNSSEYDPRSQFELKL